MSIEELLKPRIKVIAPMPLMKNKVGEFLYRQEDDKGNIWFGISAGKEMHFFKLEDFREWSNIFHICEWWEERKESELPKYVKSVFGKVVKVQRNCADVFYYFDSAQFNNEGIGKYIHYLPSTEEEYIQYKELLNKEPNVQVSDTTAAD